MEQVSSHGGRVEVRRLWAWEELVGYNDWSHLAQVCRTERVVHQQGKTRREMAYAVTSLQPEQADPARLLELWRGHWGVENRVFWVRDVTMDEDRCQIRSGSTPQIMAPLRNLVISLLRMEKEPNTPPPSVAAPPSRPTPSSWWASRPNNLQTLKASSKD